MADTTKQQADQSFFVFVKDTNTGKIRRMAIPADVQIGLKDNPAELQLHGRFSWAARDYSITNANKGILYVPNDDTIISVTLVDTPPTNRITLYLPANPRDGQLHFIKDMSGTADSVPIDVVPSPGAKIDQYDSRTLTDKYGSIALYWFGDRWRILVSGLGLVNIGAADSTATYITLSGNPTLTNERRLNVTGSNLTLVDTGPNATVNLDLSQILGGGAGTFTYATVTADAFGRITAISAGANPPPANASYITVTNEPALTGERALTAGTGILLTDAGANSSITAQINNNVVATISGSRFTGPVIAAGGLSGSLSQLSNGLSYLVAGPGLTIFTSSNGQITIGSPWTDNGTSLMTTSSVSHDGQGRFPATIGNDVYFWVSGTIGVVSGTANARRVAAFGGDVQVSGSIDRSFFGLGALFPLTIPPASASWINVNLGTTERFETQEGGVLFLSGSAGGSPNIKLAARTMPSPPYKVTACLVPLFHPNASSSVIGIAWRNSSTGALICFMLYTTAGGARVAYNKYNSPTSFNSSYFDAAWASWPYVWLRLEDDGTNRRIGWSNDGKNFFYFVPTARTDFTTPDQACILVDGETVASALTLVSWKVE